MFEEFNPHITNINDFNLNFTLGPAILGPFAATTPFSIPWPASQESFHAPSGPFGPYGPYPLCEATPVRNAVNSTTAMSSSAPQVTNQTLQSTTVVDVNESSQSSADGNATVPIDIEDEDNEEEDYEDVADEQEEEEENDGNDDDDDVELDPEQERTSTMPLFYDGTDNEPSFENAATAEEPANVLPEPAADAIPELPDGVDPSFLAALPQEMREEVLAEHIR